MKYFIYAPTIPLNITEQRIEPKQYYPFTNKQFD